MPHTPFSKPQSGLIPTVGGGTSPEPDVPDAPEASPAERALRRLSQPKRTLARFLSGQFASGALKAGGRVVIRTGPHQRPLVPSITGLMKGKV